MFSLLTFLFGWFSRDLAIDLGTANTVLYVKGKGIVLREPSVVAICLDGSRSKVLAVGEEAKQMLGRTPETIKAIRPIRDGVIADFKTTEAMLRYFSNKIHKRRTLVYPRVIITIPSGITPVEKWAVKDSAEAAGAREVYLIEEPIAAALGAGLPIVEATANMIVDIGGGTTEVAIISLAACVYSKSVRIAGDAMDDAILNYVKRTHHNAIGERTAEDIKINIGNAKPEKPYETTDIKGRDLLTGRPRSLCIDADEIHSAIRDQISDILDTVGGALEALPPELAADIIDQGIVLTGGGALLENLDNCLQEATGLPVIVAKDPLSSVVLGAGQALDNLDVLREVSID